MLAEVYGKPSNGGMNVDGEDERIDSNYDKAFGKKKQTTKKDIKLDAEAIK